MLKFKKGKRNEVTVRVFTESEHFGREFFDQHDSLEECAAAVGRLLESALKETQQDGIARQVGIAIVPRSEYGSDDGYGFDIDGE